MDIVLILNLILFLKILQNNSGSHKLMQKTFEEKWPLSALISNALLRTVLLKVLSVMPFFLLIIKFLNLTIDVWFFLKSCTRKARFDALENLPSIIALPVALVTLLTSSMTLYLSKCSNKHQNILPGIFILTLYFLFQAVWLFFLFIKGKYNISYSVLIKIFVENHMFGQVAPYLSEDNVADFVKNIQKVFLVTMMSLPFSREILV